LRKAELIGAQVTISTNVRLGLDIDEPDDLRELMTREDDSTIRDLLVAMNIMQR
jgi:2-phospho-L-lactate guanylyltransferase (CobY/MobA/RfbA family)